MDSLVLVPFLPAGMGIDVGSGAGFPGIPLAIARPDLRLTLVESRQKRAAFLRHVVAKLSLPNARVESGRIGSSSQGNHDFALARAVWPIRKWLETAAHLIHAGGRAIAMLGLDSPAAEELAALGSAIGLVLVDRLEYRVEGQAKRHLAVFQKTA